MKLKTIATAFFAFVAVTACGRRSSGPQIQPAGPYGPNGGIMLRMNYGGSAAYPVLHCAEVSPNGAKPNPATADGNANDYLVNGAYPFRRDENRDGVFDGGYPMTGALAKAADVEVEPHTVVRCNCSLGNGHFCAENSGTSVVINGPVNFQVPGYDPVPMDASFVGANGTGGADFLIVVSSNWTVTHENGQGGGGGGGGNTTAVKLINCPANVTASMSNQLWGEFDSQMYWSDGGKAMTFVNGCFEVSFTNVILSNTLLTFNHTLNGVWGIDHTGIRFGPWKLDCKGKVTELDGKYLVPNGFNSQNLQVQLTADCEAVDTKP